MGARKSWVTVPLGESSAKGDGPLFSLARGQEEYLRPVTGASRKGQAESALTIWSWDLNLTPLGGLLRYRRVWPSSEKKWRPR